MDHSGGRNLPAGGDQATMVDAQLPPLPPLFGGLKGKGGKKGGGMSSVVIADGEEVEEDDIWRPTVSSSPDLLKVWRTLDHFSHELFFLFSCFFCFFIARRKNIKTSLQRKSDNYETSYQPERSEIDVKITFPNWKITLKIEID